MAVQLIKFARIWLPKRSFQSVTAFQESGQGVFQIGMTFKAAMDGYAVDKIRQDLTSKEVFPVSDSF